MSIFMTAKGKHVLLTGPPRCGKTTVIQRLIDQQSDLRLAGFYTRELRKEGRRVGFEAVGIGGNVAPLAHVEFQSPHRVGKYGVKLDDFDALARAELDRPAGEVDLFVIDEIGKMECFSHVFVEAVQRVLNGDVPLVATVARKGGGLMAEVKNRDDVELIAVTTDNRDELPGQLADRFRR